MSIPKQILRGLILGLVLVGLILLGLFLARLPKPKPRHIQSRLGTIWMGANVAVYFQECGVPPYSRHASVDEYIEELRRGIGPAVAPAGQLKRDAKYVVFVNLAKEEWAAVRACFESTRSSDGESPSTDALDVFIVAGWQAISGPDGSRWVMFPPGYSVPCSADTFRSDVRRLDRAIRASLGKSLADCLLCEYKHFDPSTLELEDD